MNWKQTLYLSASVFLNFACTENPSLKTKQPTAENTPQKSDTLPSISDQASDAIAKGDTNIAPFLVQNDTVKTVKVSLDSPSNDTKKYIYFTIDDGPSGYSDEILALAKDRNVKMTVFLIGVNMEWKAFDKQFNDYRQSPLIEMCNHSYSHAHNHYNAFYRNPNGVLMDFYKNIVKLNLTNAIARFPGSPAWMVNGRQKNVQQTRKAAANLLKNKGFRIFGWDAEWEFSYRNGAPKGSAEQVMEDIETRIRTNDTFTKNHCVLLLHERMFQQKWEIARLVTMLQQKGYVFEHLRNFPKG
jgi:peptidoglycan/xylan/chitin deacetylase (PgdA/CDA1 family)